MKTKQRACLSLQMKRCQQITYVIRPSQDITLVTNTIYKVIGAMKSNLPADLLQGVPSIFGIPPPFVPKDRIFFVKVCKLHWRGDSSVTGIINIMTHLISLISFSSSGGLLLFPHARQVVQSGIRKTRLPKLTRDWNITFQVPGGQT